MTEALQLEIRTLRTLLDSERDPAGRAFAPLADAYRRAGKIPEALRILRDGIAKHPDFVTGHVVAAQLYVEQGLAAEGAIAARRALALDGENVSALKSLLRALDESGEVKEAEQVRSLLTTLEPEFQPDWAPPAAAASGEAAPPDEAAPADEAAPVEVTEAALAPTLQIRPLESESPVSTGLEDTEPARGATARTPAAGMIDLSAIGPVPSADLPLSALSPHSTQTPPEAPMVSEPTFDLELVDLMPSSPVPHAPFEGIEPDASEEEPVMDLATLAPDASEDEPVMELATLAPDASEEEPVMDLATLAPDASEDEPVMDLAMLAPDAPEDEPVIELATLAPDVSENEPVMELAMLAPDASEEEPVMELAMLAPDASEDEPVMELAAMLAPDAPEEEPVMELAMLAPDTPEEEPVMDLATLAPDAPEDESVPVSEDELDEAGVAAATDPLEGRMLSAESASPPVTMIPEEEPVFELEALAPDPSTENGRMADEEAREVGLVSSGAQHEAGIDPGALRSPPTVPSAGEPPSGAVEVEVSTSMPDQPAAPASETLGATPGQGDLADTDADLPSDDHGEPIPTRTLAELYAQQGAVKEAVAVLRQLLSGKPDDLELAGRIQELEGGWTPPRAPRADEPADAGREGEGEDEEVEALARELAESGRSPHAHTEGDSPFSWGDRESGSATSAEGPTIREYFDGLLQWEPREP